MKKKTPKKVLLFDTTLRDGTQGEGVSMSVDDKLKIAQLLDEQGIDYIEGGWPGSNPKDVMFFEKARSLKLKHAKLVAFGSTRRKDRSAATDENLNALIRVKTPVVCIFGKSWDFQVIHALRATLEENVKMISDSVKFLVSKKKEVIYDAEHFFDGYKANPSYALSTLRAAWQAGASNLTLCDTNGGCLPHQIGEIVKAVRQALPDAALGVHAHNDTDCAVANTLEAVRQGCILAQGCANGLGERTGNANLTSVIANLKLKMGVDCVTDAQLRSLTETSRAVAELANLVPRDNQPYVGNSAFAHKGGVHASAVARNSSTYEHIDPLIVGNKRRVLISELSGKANLHLKAQELHLDFEKNPQSMEKVINRLKELEHKGYQFEGAEASFALQVDRVLNGHRPFFELKGFRVIVEKDKKTGNLVSEATLKVAVDGREEHTVGEGNGPVEALDNGLRRALEKFYPVLREMNLMDFKVRVINASAGTGAKVRVLIESRDRRDEWSTIGVSENIIEASWQALVDAVEYKLLKERRR